MSKNIIVSLKDASLRRFVNYKSKPLVFANPINFQLDKSHNWAILGDAKQPFMQALAGDFLAEPFESRKYPALEKSVWPTSVIEFLQFTNNNYGKSADGTGNGGFTHLGARYETFKDLEIDIKTEDFICDLSYNSSHVVDHDRYNRLLDLLLLRGLQDKFINGLSNGQFRRLRIARALYRHTELLLLDDPFLGLDPSASLTVSEVLKEYSKERSIVIGLRIQDPVPDWIDHVAIVSDLGIVEAGTKEQVQSTLDQHVSQYHLQQQLRRDASAKRQLVNKHKLEQRQKSNANSDQLVFGLDHLQVSYLDKTVIRDLTWKVHHGEKWHIRGNNGTGKTTIVALLTLDHPQSWNSSITFLGEKRRTGKTNYFDTNKHIGFTSPELHALFPKQRSVFETVGNGFTVGNYLPPENLSLAQIAKIKSLIGQFGFHPDTKFKDLSISDQKVVLFLRAIVKEPEVLVLDELFSAMTEDAIDRCKEIIDKWEHGSVFVIGHVKSEIPQCDRYLQLIDPSEGKYEIGICD